jgi:hypothetical protein
MPQSEYVAIAEFRFFDVTGHQISPISAVRAFLITEP